MSFVGVCQVLAKSMMHLCHIGIRLTRVKQVLTLGVLLGNCANLLSGIKLAAMTLVRSSFVID